MGHGNIFTPFGRSYLISFTGLQLMTRDANKVADGLAKWAYTMEEIFECQQLEELPRFIQKLVFVDIVRLAYFSPKCK